MFRIVQITHRPTGSSHTIQVAHCTPSDAVELVRLTWQSRELWDVSCGEAGKNAGREPAPILGKEGLAAQVRVLPAETNQKQTQIEMF